MQHLLFVYGRLRIGGPNHHLLEDSEYLGQYETEPNYQLFDVGSYPAVALGSGRVIGEMYRVSDETLAQLDVLLEAPVELARETIETTYGTAWIYLYHGEGQLDEAITSGNWLYHNK